MLFVKKIFRNSFDILISTREDIAVRQEKHTYVNNGVYVCVKVDIL